jgi:xanthine dehydrogenase YagT iron-sulfur-binding subunit
MQPPEEAEPKRSDLELTRREFIVASSAAVAVTALPSMSKAQTASVTATAPAASLKVAFTVNGTLRELEVDPRTTLLDALREHLHLTGTKKGCDHGQCGACTVHLGDRRINSCLTLAVMHQGASITTIEGLGTPDKLHPMQAAFVKCDGYQCGYCTPGQICSAVAMLRELKAGIPSHVTANLTARPPLTPAEIRERMSGNLCRCGAYDHIVAAIQDAAQVRGG